MTYKLIDYERLKAFSESLKTKYAKKEQIPTLVSQLDNDKKYQNDKEVGLQIEDKMLTRATFSTLSKASDMHTWKIGMNFVDINGTSSKEFGRWLVFTIYESTGNSKTISQIGFNTYTSKQYIRSFVIDKDCIFDRENGTVATDEKEWRDVRYQIATMPDLGRKVDQSNITHEFMYEADEKKVLSQKGAYNLMSWANQMYSAGISVVENTIPKKLSQLTNDKTFKTESEIQQMIEKASSLKKEVITSLPTTGKDDVIYLVQDPKGKDNNNYLEYLWLNGKYELIGSTQVDLSGYVQQVELTQYANAIYDLQNDIRQANATLRQTLNKEKDKAIVPQNTDLSNTEWRDNTKYVTPQFMSNYMELQTGALGQSFQSALNNKLDKSDIQEFTQQELEEAFK